MNSKHIIKFEQGTLYLKLHEEFNTSSMELHCTMARISRMSVTVVKGDSTVEVSATKMVLAPQEMNLLTEGWQMVQDFWETKLLPERHVLLSCGCVVNWDEHQHGLHPATYEMPLTGNWTWCQDHEEARIHRFSIPDFVETDTVQA